jgi:hypothetical protein
MTWPLAGSLVLFLAVLCYGVVKLWRPFDAEGRARPLWRK